jgi:SSS family solute:Na+ symporter
MIFIASIGWLGAHILGGHVFSLGDGINLTVAKIIIAWRLRFTSLSAVILRWCGRIDTIQALILFFGFILMAILAVVHVGGWDAIVQAMDPKAMSLFAVDKLGTIPALSLAMVIGVGVLATLPIASVFTREKTSLRCAARLSIPACCICFSRCCRRLSAWRHGR